MDDGYLNEILDDGGLWNHSENPNTGLGPPGTDTCPLSSYAVRDIKKGEELLDDYGTYQWPKWHNKILDQYGVDTSYFTVKERNEDRNC